VALLPGRRSSSPVKKVGRATGFQAAALHPDQSSDILALMRGRIPIRGTDQRAFAFASGNGFSASADEDLGVHQKIFLDETKSGVIQTGYTTPPGICVPGQFPRNAACRRLQGPLRLMVSNDDKVVVS
jgi:hypothetical protein